MRIKLEDGHTCLLAVAGGQTKIPNSRFVTAIWASIDPSAGKTLRKGMRVEWRSTIDTFSHKISNEF
jgi:hypothetical protein